MFSSSEILICSTFRTHLQFWSISRPFPPLVQTPAYLLDYPNSFLTDLYISLFGPHKYFSKWNSKKSCQCRSNSVTLKPPISSHCNKKEQQSSFKMAWKTLHVLRGSYQSLKCTPTTPLLLSLIQPLFPKYIKHTPAHSVGHVFSLFPLPEIILLQISSNYLPIP